MTKHLLVAHKPRPLHGPNFPNQLSYLMSSWLTAELRLWLSGRLHRRKLGYVAPPPSGWKHLNGSSRVRGGLCLNLAVMSQSVVHLKAKMQLFNRSDTQLNKMKTVTAFTCSFLHHTAVYLQYGVEEVEHNLFSSWRKSGRNTLKLRKMLHHQSCQPRALSHLPQSLWAGASDSRTETSRCHERCQTQGDMLHSGTDTPWNYQLVSENAPSASPPPNFRSKGWSRGGQRLLKRWQFDASEAMDPLWFFHQFYTCLVRLRWHAISPPCRGDDWTGGLFYGWSGDIKDQFWLSIAGIVCPGCVCVCGCRLAVDKNWNEFTIFLVFCWEAGATIRTHHAHSVWVIIEELLYLALHPPSPLEVESVEVRAPSAEA